MNRYAVFIVGLYFLSLGIVLIVRSALGSTPVTSVNYVISLFTPLSLGTCTLIFNILLIASELYLVGRGGTRREILEIMLQLPFSFVFSVCIDFNMALTANVVPTNYLMSLALLAIGCVIQAFGVVLELKPRVVMMSAEAFVKYVSVRYNKDFGRVKVGFDVTLVCMAIALSLIMMHRVEGVREGSVIAASVTGFIVTFLNTRILTRASLRRLVAPFRR